MTGDWSVWEWKSDGKFYGWRLVAEKLTFSQATATLRQMREKSTSPRDWFDKAIMGTEAYRRLKEDLYMPDSAK